MTIKLTAQEREDAAIEFCNVHDGRSVFVGLLGSCMTCQTHHGMDAREFYAAVHSDPPTVYDEGGFSWWDCECCGDHHGGERYSVHGYIDGEIEHSEVCADCVQYLANGEPFPDDDES